MCRRTIYPHCSSLFFAVPGWLALNPFRTICNSLVGMKHFKFESYVGFCTAQEQKGFKRVIAVPDLSFSLARFPHDTYLKQTIRQYDSGYTNGGIPPPLDSTRPKIKPEQVRDGIIGVNNLVPVSFLQSAFCFHPCGPASTTAR